MIAASDPHIVSARAWVPLDDHYNLQFVMRGRLDRPVTEEEARQVRDPFAAWGGYVEADAAIRAAASTPPANIHNDYRVDYELQKELTIGIPFLGNLQDRAMTETMGPIYDRTQEHLGTTDAMVIFVRRRLIEAARALRDQGALPANVDDAEPLPGAPGLGAPAGRRELDQRDGEGAPVRRRRAHRVGAVRLMGAGVRWRERRRDLAYYEAVPYLLVLESVERGGRMAAAGGASGAARLRGRGALGAGGPRSAGAGAAPGAAAVMGPRRYDPRAAPSAACSPGPAGPAQGVGIARFSLAILGEEPRDRLVSVGMGAPSARRPRWLPGAALLLLVAVGGAGTVEGADRPPGEEGLVELPPVRVTPDGAAEELPRSWVPGAVDLLDGEEIRSSRPRVLPDAIRRLPGVVSRTSRAILCSRPSPSADSSCRRSRDCPRA